MSRAEPPRAPRLVLPSRVAKTIHASARAESPREACGVLVGRRDADGVAEVVREAAARNVHPRPVERFHLAPEDHLAAERAARADGLAVVGFWHSHPASDAAPSAVDRERAWEGYSYLIVSLVGGVESARSWRLRDGTWVEETLVEPGVAV